MAGWFGTGFLVVIGLVFGLWLLLGATIFLTHLIEKRPLTYLVPSPDDNPECLKFGAILAERAAPAAKGAEFNPYESPGPPDSVEAMCRAAARIGFSFQGLYSHAKGGIYKTHAALWVSPSRRILAIVGWGTIASVKADKTILYSMLDDGRFLVTSERPTGAETPGLYENVVVVGADFERLVERHEERLLECGRGSRPFSAENGLADYEAILARRAEFLVENRDAYYVDPDRTAIRSTLQGAFKAYARTWRAPKNIERGDSSNAVPATKRPTPPLLGWVERLCYFSLFFGFYLNWRGPATTHSQRLFRFCLAVGSLIGLAIVLIFKALLKRRADR